jgi:hypothetical protein
LHTQPLLGRGSGGCVLSSPKPLWVAGLRGPPPSFHGPLASSPAPLVQADFFVLSPCLVQSRPTSQKSLHDCSLKTYFLLCFHTLRINKPYNPEELLPRPIRYLPSNLDYLRLPCSTSTIFPLGLLTPIPIYYFPAPSQDNLLLPSLLYQLACCSGSCLQTGPGI